MEAASRPVCPTDKGASAVRLMTGEDQDARSELVVDQHGRQRVNETFFRRAAAGLESRQRTCLPREGDEPPSQRDACAF